MFFFSFLLLISVREARITNAPHPEMQENVNDFLSLLLLVSIREARIATAQPSGMRKNLQGLANTSEGADACAREWAGNCASDSNANAQALAQAPVQTQAQACAHAQEHALVRHTGAHMRGPTPTTTHMPSHNAHACICTPRAP